MSVPDERLAAALKALFETDVGFFVTIFDLDIGQLENLNYWVEYRGEKGRRKWYKAEIGLDEAIGHFLRLRREHEVGFDIESDLDEQRRKRLGIKPEDY